MEKPEEKSVRPEIAAEERFTCVTPSVENLTISKESFSKVINSHDWEIYRIEKQTPDQILAQVRCAKCGLNRIFIVSDIADSEKRAKDARQKKNAQHRLLLADAVK